MLEIILNTQHFIIQTEVHAALHTNNITLLNKAELFLSQLNMLKARNN